MKSLRRLAATATVLAALALTAQPTLAAGPTLPTGSPGQVAGSGATFPALLYKAWEATFSLAHPQTFDAGGDATKGLVMSYNAVGSGAGIKNFYGSDARKPTQLFSGSDALLSSSDKSNIESAVGSFYMLPTSLGPVAVVYNLPGLKQKVSATSTSTRAATLYLDGATIGKIFSGDIRKWNDTAIKALNPLIVNLPGRTITPVYRSDGSGTSFIWTSYLNKVSPVWTTALAGKPSKTMADKISTMKSKTTAIGASGNEGVAATVVNQVGAIGYVEIAYANQLGLKYAWVRTGDTTKKYFVPPSIYADPAISAGSSIAGGPRATPG